MASETAQPGGGDDGALFLELIRGRLTALGTQLLAALERLDPVDLHWRPGEGSNSAANLVLHICGNARQKIVANIGGQPDIRDRAAEFGSRDPLSREDVTRLVRETFGAAERVLAGLPAAGLRGKQMYGDAEVTHMETLLRCLAHYGQHVGQVLYIAKQRLGARWETMA